MTHVQSIVHSDDSPCTKAVRRSEIHLGLQLEVLASRDRQLMSPCHQSPVHVAPAMQSLGKSRAQLLALPQTRGENTLRRCSSLKACLALVHALALCGNRATSGRDAAAAAVIAIAQLYIVQRFQNLACKACSNHDMSSEALLA
jgi:hypothetical protein